MSAPAVCLTASRRLPGSEFPEKTLAEYRSHAVQQLQTVTPGLTKEIAENLINTYGSEIKAVVPYLNKQGGLERINPDSPVVKGQLEYAREHEFARTEEDFIQRRAGQSLLIRPLL